MVSCSCCCYWELESQYESSCLYMQNMCRSDCQTKYYQGHHMCFVITPIPTQVATLISITLLLCTEIDSILL